MHILARWSNQKQRYSLFANLHCLTCSHLKFLSGLGKVCTPAQWSCALQMGICPCFLPWMGSSAVIHQWRRCSDDLSSLGCKTFLRTYNYRQNLPNDNIRYVSSQCLSSSKDKPCLAKSQGSICLNRVLLFYFRVILSFWTQNILRKLCFSSPHFLELCQEREQ